MRRVLRRIKTDIAKFLSWRQIMSIKPYPCLWFNNKASEAVSFYLSVFKNGKILNTDYYTDIGEEITGHKKGDIVTIEFEILGQKYLALNAGPEFSFNPSVSFVIECKNQKEIDYYWEKLSAVKEAEQCGWLQDKFGVSWQIVPKILIRYLKKGSDLQRKNVTNAYFIMKKFDINEIKKAYKIAK
jgi:predicted 3-demethylubiquinone-9 3-methyltransferase (glyoxalase superfamily)